MINRRRFVQSGLALADGRLHLDYQTAHVVDLLKRAAAILEPQAYLVCKAVDSPSCKILDDIYHQQITNIGSPGPCGEIHER